MRELIHRYYRWFNVSDEASSVPFGAKIFFFAFTLALAALVLFLISKEIIELVQAHY